MGYPDSAGFHHGGCYKTTMRLYSHFLLMTVATLLVEQLPAEDWQRQHALDVGWQLTAVSVVDSLHAWVSGWHDSAAGLVVSTLDGGETWIELSRTLPLYINDIQFVNDSLGWIVGGDNIQFSGFIMRTTDGGQSWLTQFSDPSNRYWSVFFLDAMRGWACGDSGKILATTSGGSNWQTQYRGRQTIGFADVFFLPNGKGWCGGSFVLETTNFGAQWDSISNIQLNSFSFFNDSTGWAIETFSPGFTWKTTDGGRTWTEGLFLSQVYPTDVVMLSDSLVLSTMWDSRVDPPLDYFPISMRNLATGLPPIETRARILFGIDVDPMGHGFAVGLDEIVGTSDSGRAWTHKAGSPRISLFSIDMVDDSVGWVVGDRELIMRTTDGGKNWRTQTSATGGVMWALAAIDRDNAFAGGGAPLASGSVFMSTTDGGTTWSRTVAPGNATITGLSFIDSRKGWAATESNTVLYTTNGGENWAAQSVSSGSVRLHAIDFVDSSYGWCTGESGLVYATTDGGVDWTLQANAGVSLFTSIDFVDRSHGWAAGKHLILRTTNGGVQWMTSDSTNLAGYRSVHFVNRDTGWAVGEGVMFVGGQGRIVATTNGGVTWTVQRPGGNPGELPLYSVDAVSSNLAWISGRSGEILHTTNGGGITSVQTVGSVLPERFELEQNFPNPFNPTTTIRFGIPTSGFVSLRVYDLLGREVTTLVHENLNSGYFETHFDASHLASGIYLYRLVAHENATVRKMLLLR